MIFFAVSGFNSKDNQTIVYLVLVFVAQNSPTLENVTDVSMLLPIHIRIKYWKIDSSSSMFIYNDILLSLQFYGYNSKDSPTIL